MTLKATQESLFGVSSHPRVRAARPSLFPQVHVTTPRPPEMPKGSADFSAYAAAGFGGEIIPILPPNATMSPQSKVDPSQRGKIPGVYNAKLKSWSGMTDWTTRTFTAEDALTWSLWPDANVGLRARIFPGLDLDCAIPEIVKAIRAEADEHLGKAPARGRGNSARLLLPYRLKAGTTPVPKMRITFRHSKTGDITHAIEFLGNGQQYLIAGIHPSGAAYKWDGNIDLLATKAGGLSEVDDASWRGFHQHLINAVLPRLGCIDIEWGARGSDANAKHFEIGDQSQRADNLAVLAEAVAAIPCEQLDYEQWISLTHAIKAASGGDEGFYADTYLPWCLRYPDNTEQIARAKWESIANSTIGWDYVRSIARQHDWQDPCAEFGVVAAETQIPQWVVQFNETHFVASEGGKTLVFSEKFDPTTGRRTIDRSRFDDFTKLYAHRKGDKQPKGVGHAWLQHRDRRTYLGGVIFRPRRATPDGVYNLWRGWGIQPAAGDWSTFREHMLQNLCGGNSEYFEYLFRWMAYAVQHPDDRGHVAIVLRGGRGTGKGVFALTFGRLFGEHFVHLSSGRALTGNFNAHLQTAILVFADEAFWAGDKPQEGSLKRLITEPTLHVERKFQDAFDAPNCTHLIMASNEGWVVPAGLDERRFFVLDVSDRHKQDTEYFAAIDAQMRNGGDAGLLYDLLNLDVSKFNVRKAPNTEALLEQKLQSLDDVADFWLDILSSGEFPCDTIGSNVDDWTTTISVETAGLYRAYLVRAKARYGRARGAREFGRRLHLMLKGETVKSYRPTARAAMSNMPMPRPRYYVLPPLDRCRAAFEKFLGERMQWEDTSETQSNDAHRSVQSKKHSTP